ncbi:2TM domain-containing protein [Microbacterium sp. NPDC089189]|uniref:2TM domain-containing protein n=1 Tax=Microbacterium sp. NPDC089189 TaxID=3154972 RepID=UPI0034330380
MTDSGELRDRAINRLKARQSFWYALATWVVLSGLFTVIWLVGGEGYFWPLWPIGAIGIGVVLTGIRAFGPGDGGPPEDKIQDEMKRLS